MEGENEERLKGRRQIVADFFLKERVRLHERGKKTGSTNHRGNLNDAGFGRTWGELVGICLLNPFSLHGFCNHVGKLPRNQRNMKSSFLHLEHEKKSIVDKKR